MRFQSLLPDFVLAYLSFRRYCKSNISEHLLISCRKSYWENGREDKCIETITPRPKEKHQSSWAISPSFTLPASLGGSILNNYSLAQIHAAALYLFREKSRNKCHRQGKCKINPHCHIEGITIDRSGFAWSQIIEDTGSHILPRLKTFHRSVRISSAEERGAVVKWILQEARFDIWRYTRQQIQNLISDLIVDSLLCKEDEVFCTDLFAL